MRVAAVFARGSRFSAVGATAMDLCLRDLVLNLPAQTQTRVFAAEVSDPFPNIDFVGLPATASRKVDFAALADGIARFAPDVVWLQTDFATARKLKRRFPRVPVLVHRHRVEPKGRVQNLWRRLAYLPFVDGLIYVSETARTTSPYRGSAKHVVFNALDMAVIPAPSGQPRGPIVVYAGRLAASKGVLALAEGAAPFLATHPGWRLQMLLRPDDEPETEQSLIAALAPVAERVDLRFDATHGEVMQHLGAAAIAVAPSLEPEGFGRFPLEAMASGCAVIHANVAAFREVVADTGLELAAPITPAAITAALTRLAHEAELRATLAAAGNARARAVFDIRRSAAALQEIFAASIHP